MPPRTTLEGTGAGVSPAHQPELAQADTGHLLRVAGAPAGCPRRGATAAPLHPRAREAPGGRPWPLLRWRSATTRDKGPCPGPPVLAECPSDLLASSVTLPLPGPLTQAEDTEDKRPPPGPPRQGTPSPSRHGVRPETNAPSWEPSAVPWRNISEPAHTPQRPPAGAVQRPRQGPSREASTAGRFLRVKGSAQNPRKHWARRSPRVAVQ